jgi:hypothetical protein
MGATCGGHLGEDCGQYRCLAHVRAMASIDFDDLDV